MLFYDKKIKEGEKKVGREENITKNLEHIPYFYINDFGKVFAKE